MLTPSIFIRFIKKNYSITLSISLSEEEISAMKQELEKYGIQMPAFSKIGGILAMGCVNENLMKK